MNERPILEIGDDNVVRVVMGRAPAPRILRLAATNRSPVQLSTPDPHVAQVWIAKSASSWLVSIDESELLRQLTAGGAPLDSVLNLGAVSTRFELGHSMLVPTVLADARALPAGVKCTLDDRSVDDVLLSMESTVVPHPTSVQDLIERLVTSYRVALDGSNEAMLLVSAGWDSRLETVLLREAIGPRCQLHMLHLYTSDEELEVVAALAERTSSTLVVADPAFFSYVGLQWSGLISELQSEATWRPTVPLYSAAVALTTGGLQGVPRFGYSGYALKGVVRDEPVTRVAPRRGKYRVRAPLDPVLGGARRAVEVVRQQELFWTALVRLTEGWSQGARMAHLLWIVRYGFSLGHRPRITANLLTSAPFAFREHVADFMGLPDECRFENDLIMSVIRALAADLGDIPVISSSGDPNWGSSAVGADFNLAWQPKRPSLETIVGKSPIRLAPGMSGAGGGSPYVAGFDALAAMASTMVDSDISSDLLAEGLRRGGDAVVNGYQLASFLHPVAVANLNRTA